VPEFVQGDLFEDFVPQQKKTEPRADPEADRSPKTPVAQPSVQPPTSAAPPAPTQPPVELPANTGRVFLGWDRPVLDSATDLLIGDRAGNRLIDLSDQLVIVPTKNAGRRLREALATRAAEFDGAVVPPLIAPPEFLISPEKGRPADATPVAGNAQILLLWADILRSIDLDHFRHLFPIDPVERSFNWAIQTAGDILTMRKSLGEAGLNITDAAERLADEGMEPARWRQLADLEQRAMFQLERAGLTDIESARREAAAAAILPAEIRRVIVLATPDPTPLAIQALRKITANLPVTIAIHAPETRASQFDNWGRPLAPLWVAEQVFIPEPLNTIHLSPDPTSQAELVTQLIANHEQPDGLVAIGVPDEEVSSPLERQLAANNLAGFNPAGEPFQHHEVFYLLRVLGDLLSARSYSAFAQLIRIPDFARAVAEGFRNETGGVFDFLAVLRNFDTLHNRHLPDTLTDVQDANTKLYKNDIVPEQAYLLTFITRWLARLEGEPLSTALPAFLTMVYAHRSFDPANADDRAYAEISAAILSYLEELEAPLTRKLKNTPAPSDLLNLLLHLLAKQPFYPDRDNAAGRPTLDLQGWLELMWEDAPHLIITGFNEGKAPDAIIGDAYLPNQARAVLELRDNDHRLARDIYMLTALIESRKAMGRIDMVVGKTAADTTPLTPSRLLFLCPDDDLPARAKQLFKGDIDQTRSQPAPWESAFRLDLPPLPDDAKLRRQMSATQFGDYLRCPFRFFMKHGLRMEEYDRQKLEMDFRDFGNLCHDALEAYGKEPGIKDSINEREIRDYLIDRLEYFVTFRYGSTLPVPIMIQMESAKQRLSWAAAIEAKQRADGWQIVEAEWSVPTDEETKIPQWQIAGHPIACKIDRIERHELTDALRVLDFKTSDKATSPYESHLEKIPWGKEASDFPDWSLTTGPDGWPRHWVNLQLPLYILALRENYPAAANTETIVAGLFKLPKAKSETKIELWETLDTRTLASAQNCAANVIENIKNQVFWPPTEKPRYDDFKKILFDDATASVNAPSQ